MPSYIFVPNYIEIIYNNIFNVLFVAQSKSDPSAI